MFLVLSLFSFFNTQYLPFDTTTTANTHSHQSQTSKILFLLLLFACLSAVCNLLLWCFIFCSLLSRRVFCRFFSSHLIIISTVCFLFLRLAVFFFFFSFVSSLLLFTTTRFINFFCFVCCLDIHLFEFTSVFWFSFSRLLRLLLIDL